MDEGLKVPVNSDPWTSRDGYDEIRVFVRSPDGVPHIEMVRVLCKYRDHPCEFLKTTILAALKQRSSEPSGQPEDSPE